MIDFLIDEVSTNFKSNILTSNGDTLRLLGKVGKFKINWLSWIIQKMLGKVDTILF